MPEEGADPILAREVTHFYNSLVGWSPTILSTQKEKKDEKDFKILSVEELDLNFVKALEKVFGRLGK